MISKKEYAILHILFYHIYSTILLKTISYVTILVSKISINNRIYNRFK